MNQTIIAYTFLLFLLITYFFSVSEKVLDYKGTLAWMRPHFGKTVIRKHLQPALMVLILSEVITLLYSVFSIYQYYISGDTASIHYANLSNIICLLLMLIAQRIAKDFDGARTIVIYLSISLLALYIIR